MIWRAERDSPLARQLASRMVVLVWDKAIVRSRKSLLHVRVERSEWLALTSQLLLLGGFECQWGGFLRLVPVDRVDESICSGGFGYCHPSDRSARSRGKDRGFGNEFVVAVIQRCCGVVRLRRVEVIALFLVDRRFDGWLGRIWFRFRILVLVGSAIVPIPFLGLGVRVVRVFRDCRDRRDELFLPHRDLEG